MSVKEKKRDTRGVGGHWGLPAAPSGLRILTGQFLKKKKKKREKEKKNWNNVQTITWARYIYILALITGSVFFFFFVFGSLIQTVSLRWIKEESPGSPAGKMLVLMQHWRPAAWDRGSSLYPGVHAWFHSIRFWKGKEKTCFAKFNSVARLAHLWYLYKQHAESSPVHNLFSWFNLPIVHTL